MVVEYESSAERLGQPFAQGVSVAGHPRVLGDMQIVVLDDISKLDLAPAIPCAFAPKRREALARMLCEAGLALADALIDPTAILPPRIRIGEGSYINAGVVVGGGCFFGEGVLINRSASIGHHTVLSDYVSIAPGAVLAGNVRVGRGSMIGAGAVVQNNVKIGDDVLISAGTVVRKDVEDGALVVGNPGKVMPRRARRSSLDFAGEE